MVWSIINSISSSFPLYVQWEMELGWKSWFGLSGDQSPSRNPVKSHLTKTKDIPIAYGIPREFKNLVLDSLIIQEIVRNLCQN